MTPLLLDPDREIRRSKPPRGVRKFLQALVRPEPLEHWRRIPLPPQALRRQGKLYIRTFQAPGRGGSAAGQSLVFFSDLHWDRPAGTPLSNDLVQAVNTLAPDWIVFGGDLIRHLEHVGPALDILARLHARRGKVAVLGNWERQYFWTPLRTWRKWFEEAGFRLLVNELWAPENGPAFFGVDDLRHGTTPSPPATAETAPPPVLLVSHSPDAFGTFSEAPPFQLGLAGHTHGGQLCLPRGRALYTSSRYGRAVESGWLEHSSGRSWAAITRGVGVTGRPPLRRRLFCPPEILCIRFPRDPAGNGAEGAGPESRKH